MRLYGDNAEEFIIMVVSALGIEIESLKTKDSVVKWKFHNIYFKLENNVISAKDRDDKPISVPLDVTGDTVLGSKLGSFMLAARIQDVLSREGIQAVLKLR